jgi:2-polyprenyl-6-methoxyphenol hydroxylase-like FAD-dependent oxidoreductase
VVTDYLTFASDDIDADMAAKAGATLRRRFGDLGWVVPDLLDQADACDSVYFDSVSQTVMNHWCAGRVVLVGDAAWCVTLFGGYGSSLAVGGADLLGTMLDGHDDIPTALQAWEQQLRPIAEKKQLQGRRSRHLFVTPNEFTRRMQLAIYRLTSSKLVLALLRRFLDLETVAKAART